MKKLLLATCLVLLFSGNKPHGQSRTAVVPMKEQYNSYDVAEPMNDLIPLLDSLAVKTKEVAEKLELLY